MTLNWKHAAMIMLVGLSVFAGPMPPRDAVAQAPGVDKTLSDAYAAQDRATKAYTDMMTKMTSLMKNMPMDENEKSIMALLQQIADTIKMQLDAHKVALDALKELRQLQK